MRRLLALFGVAVVQLANPGNIAVGQQQRPDSQHVLDDTRSAQRRFERVRRQHLPSTPGGVGSSCDERVGRFCFWHDEDPPWEPAPEDPRITQARERLLHELDSAAGHLPADEWVAGQRVRYLVEAQRWDGALQVARGCRAAPWRCGLLEGFVHHTSGDFAAADSVFDAALADSPEELRCDWTDLSKLLDGDLEPSYRDASCADRLAANRRIWWLADPLYLVPGNERRTEHLARIVVVRFMQDADNAYGIPWGRDNRELTMRYGWTVGWERVRFGRSSLNMRPEVTGHHAPGSKHFIPPREYVNDATGIVPAEWELEPNRPRTRYAPRYAREFGQLEPQVAVFRRGDSVLVVAAFDVQEMREVRASADSSAVADSSIDVALVLARDEHAAPVVVQARERGEAARLLGRTPHAGALLSVEALYRADSVAARERYWLARQPDHGGLRLSDLLLIDADSLPNTLEEAALLARPSATFAPGEIIDVYWEVYGIPAGASGVVSLTVVKQGKSFFRKAVEFLGLAGGDNPTIRLQWTDAPGVTLGGVGRSVSLQLPEEQDGRYTLRLEAVLASGEQTVTTKQILVEEP
jgi:hypothetical protein